MIWKTTLAKIFLPFKNVKNSFHHLEHWENLKSTSRFGILMSFFFTASLAVNAQNNLSSVSGDNCITFDSCPSDQELCADTYEDGVLGADVSWTDPFVSQTCTPNGRPGNFQMLFELNEQLLTVDCWDFNYISRVGSDGGQIKLFSGEDKYKTSQSVIITPFLILKAGSETSIDVDYVNGDYTVQLYLIDENDNLISMDAAPVPVNENNLTYTFFTPNTETGVYRLKYVFEYTGKEPSNANNGDTLIAVDGMLSDKSDCSAGVDFTVTAPTQGFYPVGSHDLQYVATYTAPDGTIKTKTCSFNISVYASPVADDPVDVTECDSYTLPDLNPGNQYFTGTGATGTELFAGDVITTSQNIYVYAAASAPCVADENMFTVTINETPVADAPTDFSGCDSYTLPDLSPGNQYFTGTGASGTELFADDVITTTQDIYVYAAATAPCVPDENMFTVTINNTPLADAPGNVESCDSYILPALTNGAYYTSPNGVDPIAAGTEITATQTIYVFSPGTGACGDVENSFTVTINDTPLADAPGDVESCDSYTLPALTNGMYFASPGGVDPIAEGTEITATQTIYVFSAGNGSCENVQNSFTVTINDTPLADAPGDVESCDSYTLPALTNGTYFASPDGVGPVAEGTEITATQTIYVFSAGNGSCENVQNSFEVTINNTPLADAPGDVESCDSYTLPALTNGTYFASPDGVGPVAEGSEITSTQTMYVFAAGNGSCENVQNSFTVTINDTPLADAPGDVESCDSYTLPALTNGAYYASPDGVGPIAEGTEITATQTIYVFSAGNGSCENVQNSFTVTINNTPLADAPGDIERCDSYILPALTNGAYYASPGGVDPIAEGTEVNATQTLYVYSPGSGSCENTENSFTVTITDTPIVDAPSDVESCDSYILPVLTNGAYYTAQGGVGPIAEGTEITSTQTIYVYSPGSGSCVEAENSFTVTINNTPLADAPGSVESCDSYILPILTNGAYFASQGGLDPIAAGTEITATQDIYVYSAGNGSCADVESSFKVTINNTPTADAPDDVERCDSYTLPALTNGAYFASSGGADPINEGAEITTTQTIYVYSAGNGSCEDAENSFLVTINQTPAPPSIQVIISPSCGETTGSFAICCDTGLEYSIDGENFFTEPIFKDLLPDTYYVVARSPEGCISEPTEVVIEQQPEIPATPVLSEPATQPTCDVATGVFSITAVDGMEYSFDGGDFRNATSWTDLAPETYTVVARNADGCVSEELSVTIDPQPLTPATPVLSEPATQPTCDVATGAFSITAVDGMEYSFDGGDFGNATSWTDLAPETYTVVARNADGCVSEELSVTIDPQPLTPATPVLSEPAAQPTCDVATGAFSITAVAGMEYSFDGGAFGNTTSWTDLAPKNYTVVARNADGCVSEELSVTIDPQPLTPAAPVLSEPATQPTCDVATGAFSITAVAGMEYSFDGGTFGSATSWTDLAPKTYTVVARNSDGCLSEELSVIINTQPETPAKPVVEDFIDASCEELTGMIVLALIDGITYTLTDEDGNVIEDDDSDGIFNNVAPGFYSITAENSAGCISPATERTISTPQLEVIPTVQGKGICTDEGIDFSLSELLIGDFNTNGTWEDPANTGALENGSIDPALLEVGIYTFNYVLSVDGCTSITEASLTINDDCVRLACELEDVKASISKAVTPNGDNINDYFTIGLDLDCGFVYAVKIFNRWGNKVYESNNYQNDWDGTSRTSVTGDQLPSGTYYYIVEISGLEPVQGYIYLGTK